MSVSLASVNDLDLDLELSGDRVREHTAPHVNQRIDAATQASIEACVAQGPKAIARRLRELDREWDVDRAVMVTFGVVGGTVFLNGIRRYAESSPFAERRKGLLYLFGAQLGFLTLHGIMGWCPPAALFRRLGYRTMREIEAERRILEGALAAPGLESGETEFSYKGAGDGETVRESGHQSSLELDAGEMRTGDRDAARDAKRSSRRRSRAAAADKA
jgi:hypothetical protein